LKTTSNPKFCSRSCSASFNNKGIRRHGNPLNPSLKCAFCQLPTKNSGKKYCSRKCYGSSKRLPEEERKLKQRHSFMKYYMKKKRQTPLNANIDKIKEIYLNCPAGYEVNHIIPISKGGPHHQDNLQYLTVTENRKKGNKVPTSA
jgi:hypothetical protein